MRINATSAVPITCKGKVLEEVESFTYRRSIIGRQGSTDVDIKIRIGKANPTSVLLYGDGKDYPQ